MVRSLADYRVAPSGGFFRFADMATISMASMAGVSCRRIAVWICGFVLVASAALGGGVSGTVRGPGGAPVEGSAVQVFDAFTGNPVGFFVSTDSQGRYSFEGIPASQYFLYASSPFPNPQRYVGELYSGMPGSSTCGARGTEVVVGSGTTTGIDFSFQIGASISGSVTRAGTGAPSLGTRVVAYDVRGCLMAVGPVDAAGLYTIPTLPPGFYYLATESAGVEADRLYPALPCVQGQCNVFAGTLVPTGGTANFVLAAGSSITGALTGPGAVPLPGAEVSVWKGAEKLATTFASNGSYTLSGLSVATGYRVLAKTSGMVAEVYPNAPCPGGTCNVGGSGSPIDIAAPGSVVSGRDLQLAPGHSISGTLAPGNTQAVVQVYGSTGLAGQAVGPTNTYTVRDLPDGSYAVRAMMGSQVSELYDNQPCPANQVCLPDPVVVSGADRTGINFSLAAAHRIGGTIRSPAGDPISGVPVEVLAADGTLMSSAWTALDGTYLSETEGLPAGTYFVRTRLPRRIHQYIDRLWPDRPCGASCIPTTGGPVTVAATDITGVDFVLPFAGLDYFTVPPCRIFDSRSGSTIASGVLVGLRFEAACGIPGNAVAVSANVTSTSVSATGSIALWAWNLPNQPPTSTLNVAAGASRANNAVLEMSLEGPLNLALRGVLPGGRYHLIIDVNGYFARATPP